MRLGVDTSGQWLALALTGEDGTQVHSVTLNAGRRHATLLLPEIDALLRRTGIPKTRLECVVSGTGPGSYTGLRVGLAAAAGIARGLGIPHYGADSLAAAARPLLTSDGKAAWVTLDARRGNVYAGCYSMTADRLDTVVPPLKLAVAELQERTAAEGVRIVSAGAPDAAWLASRAVDRLPPVAVYL